MRIRLVVPLAVAAVLLSGCGGPGQETAPSVPPLVSVPTMPSQTPSETPSSTPPASKVADTVCVRMDQGLVQATLGVPSVQIRLKAPPADFGVPVTYDGCELGLGGSVLRVGTSVQSATKATLAAVQKAYKGEPAKPAVVGAPGVTAPGFGASSFVVFLLDGQLYKVSGPKATLAKYIALAEEVARQVDGLPAPEPLITRPECDRGSAAAVKVMGGPPMFRRDGQTANGDLVCGWIAADGVLSTSARRTPKAAELMTAIRKTPTAQALPLGDEGYVDTATGRTTIRIGDGQLIDFVPLPARAINPDTMTQLALAMLSQYR
ncbi:hypothetical protein E1263_35795 [Kribbella antibiotica]|uniref:DUF3558 domain-containing protein n=1 Tax=Kribbella antibiotica TaxID=190195 RepID=A0A4R4YNW3_9ACTN|nr:hypothetical protein [Kribbella antibiotica]TDD46805.1 hypothetical protein E1263_35795 [Kribbella antibiotica]